MTQFTASKQLRFDGKKVLTETATITGHSQLRLCQVSSTLPGLRGRIVRRVARNRFAQQRPQATAIVKQKTLHDVRKTFDQEFDQKISRLNDQLASDDFLQELQTRFNNRLDITFTTSDDSLLVWIAPEGRDVDMNVTHYPFQKSSDASIQMWLPGDAVRRSVSRSTRFLGMKLPISRLVSMQAALPTALAVAGNSEEPLLSALAPNLDFRWLDEWFVIGLQDWPADFPAAIAE